MEENIVMQAREQAGKKVVSFINEGKFPEALNFLNEYKTLEPMLFSLTQAPKSNPVESNSVKSNSVKSNSEEPHLNLKLPLPEAKDAFGMQDNFDDNDMKVKSVVTKKNSKYINDKWFHHIIEIDNWIIQTADAEKDGLTGTNLVNIYYNEFKDNLSPHEKEVGNQGMPFRGRVFDSANRLKNAGYLSGKQNFFKRTDKIYLIKTR
jgi:hypothetical protein